MTVHTRVSNRRADEDSLLLLDRLERFVNLADDFEAFGAFFRENPGFLPVTFHTLGATTQEPAKPVGWGRAFYDLFRVFRDLLRELWERGSDLDLAILLGTDEGVWEIINRKREPGKLDEILSGPETAINNAMTKIPRGHFAVPSKVQPNWRTGTFRYEADTDFRRAVYELFRRSWRAKICPRCSKYFIADKPAQFYCSTKCYGKAKRDRDLQYWRDAGGSRRKKRLEQQREIESREVRREGR